MTAAGFDLPRANAYARDRSLVAAYVKALAAQPGMNPWRLYRALEHALGPEHFEGKQNEINRQAADKLSWPRFRDGTPRYRLSPVAGMVSVVPVYANTELIGPVVADRVTAETEAVIELGSGLGRHLFDVRDLIEHKFPHVKYFGGDINDDVLDACRAVAALEPRRAPISFHKFDHLAPDLGFLNGIRNAVFFTSHTIEQVTYLTDKLALAILAAADKFVCIHDEPVGWQLNDEVATAVANNAFPTTPRVVKPYQPIDDFAAAAMPAGSKWNHDLVAVLRTLLSQGKIKVERVDKHSSGHNLYNPTTRIIWTRA